MRNCTTCRHQSFGGQPDPLCDICDECIYFEDMRGYQPIEEPEPQDMSDIPVGLILYNDGHYALIVDDKGDVVPYFVNQGSVFFN